jgi:hypothetical protein
MSQDRFVFLVPEIAAVPTGQKESDVALLPRSLLRRATEVSISRKELEDFWKENVVGLVDTLADAQASRAAKGFGVDEISFSIGVGAKGGLFFVAEGSVEASMTITLRRAG